jgi:hypothetical protein
VTATLSALGETRCFTVWAPLARGSGFARANPDKKKSRGSCRSALPPAAGTKLSFPVPYYAVRGGLSDGD